MQSSALFTSFIGCGLLECWCLPFPLLGSLAEENGAWVHPLLEDSPAIDKGLCLPGVTTVDQRGATRPMGNACDIGAYEFDDYRVHLPLVLSAY